MTFPPLALGLGILLSILVSPAAGQPSSSPEHTALPIPAPPIPPGTSDPIQPLYAYSLSRASLLTLRSDGKTVRQLILKPRFHPTSANLPFDMAVFAAVKHKEYAQNTDPIILPPGDKSSVTLSNPTVIGNLHLSMKELSQTLRDYGLTGNLSKDTTLTEIRFIPQLNTYGGQQYLEYEVRLIIVDKEPLTTTLRAKPSPPAKPGT